MAMVPRLRVFLLLCVVKALFWGVSEGSSVCPKDYRYRFDQCILEAEVAPQAGGGLQLITDPRTLERLCQRGVLQKSIACLRQLQERCAHNASASHELSMLYDVKDWELGRDLLCQDTHLFRDNFGCLVRHSNRITNCVRIRTEIFRREMTEVGHATPGVLHDIACNFAENIVYCLSRPLKSTCPSRVTDTLATALHRFLSPACAPVPAVRATRSGEIKGESYVLETVITEGGNDESLN